MSEVMDLAAERSRTDEVIRTLQRQVAASESKAEHYRKEANKQRRLREAQLDYIDKLEARIRSLEHPQLPRSS